MRRARIARRVPTGVTSDPREVDGTVREVLARTLHTASGRGVRRPGPCQVDPKPITHQRPSAGEVLRAHVRISRAISARSEGISRGVGVVRFVLVSDVVAIAEPSAPSPNPRFADFAWAA